MARFAMLLSLVLCTSAAHAEPFRVSVNLTTGGRWLEGAKVWAGKSSVQLEGSELTMGGTLDLMHRFSALRLGGQVGADVMLFARDVNVVRSGPLNTIDTSSSSEVSSLVFVTASPFVGAGVGEPGQLQGWVDVLVSLELATARIDGERHFALTPVPTVRLGASFPLGFVPTSGEMGDAAFELSFFASYFGAPRLALGAGVRF